MAIATNTTPPSDPPPRGRSRAATFAAFQRHALIPKPKGIGLAELNGSDFAGFATRGELRLLDWIAERADALVVEGKTYALIYLPNDMADQLAAIRAVLDDREPDPEIALFADMDLITKNPYAPGVDEDAEEGCDLEAVNEDGDELDRGEFDESDQGEPENDAGDGVGCPPEIVARKRAIIAERRAAAREASGWPSNQRHRLIATSEDGSEMYSVEPRFPAFDAMPVIVDVATRR